MKSMLCALFVLLLVLPVCCAQADTYTLGGSEADVINYMAAMPDGGMLLAGFTMSSDGTLADRTKQGRTGWLARVDAQGNTLWNFCTRQGSSDQLMAPAVHADGTITVLLDGNGSENNLVELIRLDAQGAVLSRKTLVRMSNDEGSCCVENPGVFSGGYVIASVLAKGPREITYRWFDFDGNPVKTVGGQSDNGVMAVSERHIIEMHDGAYWLCSLDGKGNDTPLCRLFDEKGGGASMEFMSLVSLEDGGAIGCLHQRSNGRKTSRIVRFDADGGVVFQLDFGGFMASDIGKTPGGFAMTGKTSAREYRLYFMDGQGAMLGGAQVASWYDDRITPFAVLADGRAAVACQTAGQPGSGSWVNYDVALHIKQSP